MIQEAQSGACPGEGSQIQEGSRFLATAGVVIVLAVVWMLTTTTFGTPASSALQPDTVGAVQAGDGTLVRIGDGSEPKYVVEPSGQVTVSVEVVDAVNLGTATVLVFYDPAVVQAVGCAGPPGDVFDGGYCNLEYALGAVKFTALALEGVDGTHRLYDITFEAVGGGATQTDLTLTVEHFADPLGNALDVDTAGGEIEIVGEAEPVDAVVRVGDETQSDFTLIPGNSIVISVTLSITGTRELGAATILLRYDPAVVRPTMCSQAEEIMGYCNPAFDREAGLVKFNLVSSEGLTGTLHAYDVTFEVASGVAGGAASDLVLIVEHFADPLGLPMSWQAVNGTVTVAEGPSNSAWVLVGGPSESGVYTVTHGTTVTASVWVTDVVGLGAATLSLGYDPSVVRALGCAVRDGASGIDGGVCALHEGQVQASLISSQGISGTARLYDVDFTPALGVAVGTTSTLTLTVENFADTAALPVPSRVRNGAIEIEEGGSEPSVALVRVGNDGGVFELPQDDRVAVPIRVEGAADLGAATLSLSYDPAVARSVSCAPGDAVFDGGFCNPQAGDGLVRLNVVSQQGFTGDATLFELTFQAVDGAAVGDETDLELTVTNFASSAAEALLYQTASGTIVITQAVGPPQIILRVGGGPYQVAVGERVTVPISAVVDADEAPLGLGAVTLVLDYDPSVVQPVACALNDAGGDGFDGGGCNLNYAVGQVKFNALSVTGVMSDTTIVEVEFEGVGQEGEATPLALVVNHLADTAANALTYRVEEGEIGIPPEDGNGDGIPDRQQDNVMSVRNIVDGSFVTLASPEGTSLEDVSALVNPSDGDSAVGADFPVGFFAFGVQGMEVGGAITVTLFLPAGVVVDTYYKYGPTQADPTPHEYEFLFDGTTGAEILGEEVLLHFVDGERGDWDLTANGETVDPGGPAVCGVRLAATFVSAEPSSSVDLTAQVSSSGSVQVPAGLPVAFYLGDPGSGGTLIATAVTSQALSTGDSEEVTVTWNNDAPGDHSIFIVANDGNPFNLCGTPPTVQQTVSILDVPLAESWNLMSAHVNPFNRDASVVQLPIAGQYVVIHGFDAGGAKSYYSDLPPAVNTLQEIDAEHGYWIKAKASTSPTLRVVGEKLAEDQAIELGVGWNLVSYLPRQARAVQDALQSIEGWYTAVLGYDERAVSYYPGIDPSFNTLHEMEPLFGYWINMTQAGALRYPATVGGQRSDRMAARSPALSLAEGIDELHPTPWFVDFLGQQSTLNDQPLPVGAVIRAYDPSGVLAGRAEVTLSGWYLMSVYGDDPLTEFDEGAESGDAITFTVDGHPAVCQGPGPPLWGESGERVPVELAGCPLRSDLDCDCEVDVADVMMVSSRWGCQGEDACYDAHCDLDGDGDIDIVDIMQVVAHWGEVCSP